MPVHTQDAPYTVTTVSRYAHLSRSSYPSTKDIHALLQGVVSRMDMLSGKFDESELRFDKVGFNTLPQDVPSRMNTVYRRFDKREDVSSLGYLSAVS
jgi:hypothetical protein